MPDDPLHVPLLKIGRAHQHIEELRAQIDAFLVERPFRLMIEVRRGSKRLALRTEARKRIPPELSLIIGDAIHNLRTALDLALYVMASDRVADSDRRKIQFPFADDAAGFDRALKDRQVRFAGTKVLEAIRRSQAYRGGNQHLHAIHVLDIRDKHRLLILSRSIPEFVTGTDAGKYLTPFIPLPPDFPFPSIPPGVPVRFTGPEHSDLIFAELRGGGSLPDMKEETPVQPRFAISFSEEPFKDTPVIDALTKAEAEVRRAVESMIVAFMDEGNAFP